MEPGEDEDDEIDEGVASKPVDVESEDEDADVDYDDDQFAEATGDLGDDGVNAAGGTSFKMPSKQVTATDQDSYADDEYQEDEDQFVGEVAN